MTASRRDERTAETREELIVAARSTFVDRGFAHASLGEIARRAGFTTGAIYGHFKSKDELFLAVFEAYALDRVREVSSELDAVEEEKDMAGRGRAAADQWMERHLADPHFSAVALEFAVHALRKPALREALATRYAALREAVARSLERDATAAGVTLPLPALELATVLRELGVGLGLAQLIDPDAVRPSLFGDFVEGYLRSFSIDGAATAGAESHG